jgi:16S rRNA G966 N2-methylase RsmD
VIFLDPPFEQGLLLPTIAWCYSTGMADDNTVISFEAEKYLDLEPEALPEGVQILKHKKTKHIQYGLIGCA